MFFEYAFTRNQWLWFHMLAGGIAIKTLFKLAGAYACAWRGAGIGHNLGIA